MSARSLVIAAGLLTALGCRQAPPVQNVRVEATATVSATMTASSETRLQVEDLVWILPSEWSVLRFDGRLTARQGLVVDLAGYNVLARSEQDARELADRLLRDKELSAIEMVEASSQVRDGLTIWKLRGRAKKHSAPAEWIAILVPRESSTVAICASSPDAQALQANLADFDALLSNVTVQSPPSPTGTPSPGLASASPSPPPQAVTPEVGVEEPALHFDANMQWTTPATWVDQNGKWLTPNKVLLKYWLTSDKNSITAQKMVGLLRDSGEFTEMALAEPPRPGKQNDFRLWMARGTALKKDAKGKEEAVDWSACLVEPLAPVEPEGHKIFVAIGSRGQSRECEESLLTLTQTIAPSQMGAAPAKIRFTVGQP